MRHRASIILLCLLASCAGGPHDLRPAAQRRETPTARPPAVRHIDFLEQYASTYRFRAGTPTAITPTPDGSAVLFLRSGPRSRVQDLYEFNIATGAERVILTADQVLSGGEEKLTPEELARRERMRQIARGLSSFELSDDGTKLLVPLSGKLFVVDRATGKPTLLPSAAGYPIDPRFSPDARKVACVRDGDLYVTDLTTSAERRLTTASKPTITHGLAEFVAQEEMDRFAGYWWSPDSTRIAYEQADTDGLETFTIADPVNPEKPAQTWPYPRPGRKNADVRLFVTSATPGDAPPVEVAWDHGKYEYLASVRWPKGAPLTLTVMNRAQTELAVLAADPDTGATTPLLVERDPAWINLDPSVPAWLEDGSGFLWITERTGKKALEFRSRDGSASTIAGEQGPAFAGLAHLDRASGVAHLIVGDDPAESHVARLSVREALAQKRGTPGNVLPPAPLTRGSSVNSFAAGKPLSTYVISTADLAGSRSWRVFRADGTPAGELRSVAETPSIAAKVELETVGPRAFRAAVIRPRDFDPARKYPVILSVYAGPHATVVSAAAAGQALNQWLADQGFIVAMLDGRGTPRRGRDWERAIKHDLISIPLEDQVEGLRALGAKHPEMDLSRVGVYGWSFGGYFSAMAAMRRPDVFQAACAGAPVADWYDYDTCYTERYLGVPDLEGNLDPQESLATKRAYELSSVLTYGKDLRVPLMIVHGTADDNVYFMHSLKMADVLFKNGKDYDFLVLPGFTHMVPDPVVTRSLYSRIAKFFLERLGAPK